MTGKLTTTPVTLAIRTPKYDLMAFSSTGFGSVRCFDAVDNAWFLGKDVATALGYPFPIQAVRARVKSCDRKVFLKSMFNPPEQQTPFELPAEAIPNRGATFINEAGICSLVIGSKHSAAKDFLPWVFRDILPALQVECPALVSPSPQVATEPMVIGGVECFEKDGIAYLRLETVARGLGFTEIKNGIEYIKWRRVETYLRELSFATCGERPEFVPESVFYMLAMKANNETAHRFQWRIANDILPTLRRTGTYSLPGVKPEASTPILVEAPEVIAARQKMEEAMVGPDELWTFTRTAKCFGVSISELTNYLRDSGYIEKNSDDLWLPTDKQGDRRFFEVKTRMPRCGKGRIFPQAYTTQAGRAYFSTLINAARVAGELYKGSEANKAAGAKRRKNPS